MSNSRVVVVERECLAVAQPTAGDRAKFVPTVKRSPTHFTGGAEIKPQTEVLLARDRSQWNSGLPPLVGVVEQPLYAVRSRFEDDRTMSSGPKSNSSSRTASEQVARAEQHPIPVIAMTKTRKVSRVGVGGWSTDCGRCLP